MTDLTELRAEILAARGYRDVDALSRVSTDGLVALFNRMSPPELRISTDSNVTLTIRPTGGALTGRQVASLIDHFSRAVASMAQELSPASERDRQLAPSDYVRAPIYPTVSDSGLVVIAAAAGAVTDFTENRVESRSEAALIRLANLLPETDSDPRLSQRVLSARVPAARAMQEVALAARRVGGLEATLTGRDESLTSVVLPEQARMIEELLKDTREEVTTQHVSGRLDGMRFSRREFFLELGDGHDLSGVVDEDLVTKVRALLDRHVEATVERVVRETAAGRKHRAAFRLVGLEPSVGQDKLI